MDWAAIKYGYGSSLVRGAAERNYMRQAHVIPVGDKRFHTVPMCWCKPVESEDSIFVHNAIGSESGTGQKRA